VVRTRVGYAGGTTESPTYHRLGDHTETVQLDYDPTKVSYAELLEVFWQSHDPSRRSHARQYMAAIFYHSSEQERLARESAARVAAATGRSVRTAILPAGRFYLAEAYHQKYRLRQHPELLRELRAIYPSETDLTASTAAARLNGYLAGCAGWREVRRHLPELGLSSAGGELLLRLAG